ncbi:type VI secretion system-associated protein TagF [Plastoroseomonas arctica]|uniref:Type VI secretion system-associated protein TagF n=1 Tax=Plastoroseomonas arctica TaxID=1509237 RepID=A0AAF1K2V3_9PROT|nr:type VI secretion system-associated protein TagF [Plastoroseomonas arctica]MBR0655416.1 type VI secretion system-associated protein TagF [Plastoroseomonas arctica]
MPDAQPELSGAPLALGIYGKMPAHGDFVRRGLPSSFVAPWDAWLAAGVAAAREQLDAGFAAVWDEAPAWRFSLPAGVCGPDAVAGVMLPSEDTVGRRFPLTAAALLPPGVVAEESWFTRLEAAVRAARQGALDADGMIRAMQSSPDAAPEAGATSGDVLGMLGGGMAAAAFAEPAPVAAAPTSVADNWDSPLGADPMEGPAESVVPAADDMWGALLGDAPADPAPKEDPLDGPVVPSATPVDWSDVIGDAPLAAPPPMADMPEAGDMWGNLLGDPETGRATTEASGGISETVASGVTDENWDELLADTVEVRPNSATAAAGPAPDASGGQGAVTGSTEEASTGDRGRRLPGDADIGFAHTEPTDPAAESTAAMVASVAAAQIAAAQPFPDAAPPAVAAHDVATNDAPPHAPLIRPEHGGWWTLGGAHLSPMVWPLPELPPAESFILLLHNQDPESGA